MGEKGRKKRRWLPAALAVCMLAAACLVTTPADSVAAMASVPLSAAVSQTQPVTPAAPKTVIPMGTAVGIKLFSDGVLVVGLSGVETEKGSVSPGKLSGLKAGDVITHINGSEVDTIEQVQKLLAEQGKEQLTIQAVRSNRNLQLTARAVENQQGVRQLGVWLRDSMAGIGTVTWYDPTTGAFAALGHGVNDTDTATLMPLESGSIMPASVSEVKKGLPGQPGELHGDFDLTKDLGTLSANTERGIFGRSEKLTVPTGAKPMEVAKKAEVKTGKAAILSNVRGEQVEEFDVELICVDQASKGTRNMLVKVTDPELLELTGGIVQGMSGSPIIQDGRLVGAVTHVLVNDPTRGYGIFIENMLDAAG